MAKYQEAAPVILKALEDGYTMQEAADMAGITKKTLYEWTSQKSDFSNLVQCARKDGEHNILDKAVSTLVRLAIGGEYEDVRTEYASELNTVTGKYEPVIRKQTRVKKTIPPNIEALKFLLTNRDPANWRNRQEHDIKDLELLKNLHIERVGSREPSGMIANSEDEVKDR